MFLSIIVIEYNSLEDISEFNKRLHDRINGFDYELIVSSNSQYAPSKQQEICLKFPNIQWTFNKRNGGFAYGMNRGLELANGDYMMIANPDLRLVSGIDDALKFLLSHKEVGVIGPLIKNKAAVVQDSARDYVTLNRWVSRNVKRLFGVGEQPFYDKIQTVDWIIGACMIVTRETYDLTGGLDEHYFLYVEDMDFCTRIRLAGKEVVHYPNMVVEYEGTRAARHSLKYARVFVKSLCYYWRRFGLFKVAPKRKVSVY